MSQRSAMLPSKLTKTKIALWILNRFVLNFPNRAHFSEPVEMSPSSAMLQSKLIYILKDHFTGNGNFSLKFVCHMVKGVHDLWQWGNSAPGYFMLIYSSSLQ